MQNWEMRKTSNCSHWYFHKKNRQTFCVSFFIFFLLSVLIFLLLLLFFLFFLFFEAVLLYSSGWPEIHYVVRLALNLWQSPCLSSVEIIGLSWEYGFRVQHLPTACSRIWVSFTALFSSFSTNKQTNISDPDWQLTSGILAHQLRICNGYESILWVWQNDEKNPPGSLTLKVLTALLSYILGTREISLRVAKSPLKQK